MRKSPAEHMQEKLTAHSLMVPTSALLLLDHNSFKCLEALMEEEKQHKPIPTLSLFPVLVSCVQPMGKPNSIGVRKESAGSHTWIPATDVSDAKAVVRIVSLDNSSGEVAMALIQKMAIMTPLTNAIVKGTVLICHPT